MLKATRRRPLAVVLGCVLCLALVRVAAARADVGHPFGMALGEGPIGVALAHPAAVAVDEADGELFVGDAGAGAVDVYSSAGAFLQQFGEGQLDPVGIGVDEANGLVYVANGSEDTVVVLKPNGGGYQQVGTWYGEALASGEFGQVTGVAVDNSAGSSSGDVYVVDAEDQTLEEGAIDVFTPRPAGTEEGGEGSLVRQLTAGKLDRPNGIAIDSATGRVLVADNYRGAIYVYSAEGALVEKVDGKGSPYGAFAKEAPVGDVTGIAVDPASGDVYVAEAERHAVSQYGATGEWLGWLAGTPTAVLGEPLGVALNGAHNVYVTDAGLGVVDDFGAGVGVPAVETGKVAKSAVARTSVVLSGSVDGEGEPVRYRFQYGETEMLGSETTVEGAGSSQQSVSGTAEHLQAGHTYHYRLIAEGAQGANYGAVLTVTTPAAVEGVETGGATGVTQQQATFTGSLKRDGIPTRYYFQYGTSEAYGASAPVSPAEIPTGASEKEEKQARTLEATASDLAANTLYHYRLVAENSYGRSYGADRAFTTPGPPRVGDEPATEVGQEVGILHAEVDPDLLATSYRFQYGETAVYGGETDAASAGSGSTPVAESATLTGLRLGVTYHFRIVAENGAGTTYGEDETFTTVASAKIDATYATGVQATEATLRTSIDPLGHETHYYFQYGTQICANAPGACTDTPAPPGNDIGEGSADVAGEATLSGLTPGVSYHYRVIAANSLGLSEGPEETFTTKRESSFALPDGRVWEMVTPANKHGAAIEPITREGGWVFASESGEELTYVTNGPLVEDPEGNRSPEMQQALARRTASGWTSEDIVTPQANPHGLSQGDAPEYQFFSPDLSSALVLPWATTTLSEPPLTPEATQSTMYLRDDETGTYVPLVTEGNVPPGTTFGGKIHFRGATPDLSHVVLESEVPLAPRPARTGLYEWSAGRLQFVSVLPDGRPAREPRLGYYNIQAHAISADGTRVIFTTSEQVQRGHLYMRDTASGQTVQLDAAQGVAEPGGVGEARFESASGDGSRVFFTDEERLTADSTAEPGNGAGESDLYECEMVETAGKLSCRLRDLSVPGNEGEPAAVQGLLFGTGEDGTSAYLVAEGVLASNENGDHEQAQAGGDNLYALQWSEGEWSTTFIGTLAAADSHEWEGQEGKADTGFVTARVSPNGRYLAFMSAAPLTGYENVDQNTGQRDEEVYLYDSQTQSLRCVSCDPTGERPIGVQDKEETVEGLGLVVDRREVWLGHTLAGSIPGWTPQTIDSALYQSRYLTDEGRLYFDSPDDLVPAATNGKEDVYEYEPAGVGSCQSETGGCVSLISSGTSQRESAFVEATPDGSNVFFLTEAQLLSQDTDTAFDIYDARECSASSPCLGVSPSRGLGCAETSACRPAEPAKQLPGAPAGTATFSGSGNAAPTQTPAAKQGVQAKKVVRPLTRAQELTLALKSCRKHHRRRKRQRLACERNARDHYSTKAHTKTRKPRRGRGRRR